MTYNKIRWTSDPESPRSRRFTFERFNVHQAHIHGGSSVETCLKLAVSRSRDTAKRPSHPCACVYGMGGRSEVQSSSSKEKDKLNVSFYLDM
ncbi:hypothetical protein AVEN_71624-1 [Araneus ventricosus]|uniref:Uncharacterized protein n=1 Tax=Araneus ventricosus TaxID=182803 RepID=A0A4Y2GFF2_ARAVE|nr:hypothetical protein AVEN_71624-1 [Araneus ventricosus]